MRLDRFRGRVTDRSAKQGRPRYVFVVTYGRSGSTLVQGLLNTLPGTLVRGENGLYVLHSFRAWRTLRDFKHKHEQYAVKSKRAGRPARSAFHGLDEMSLAPMVSTTRGLVTQQLFGEVDARTVEVLGFKEVRWHKVGPAETEDFFLFVDEVFPGAKYVMNRRDHADVAESGFWRREAPGQVTKAIQRVEDMQDHLRATRPGRTLDVRYESLTSEDAAVVSRELRAIAEFTLERACDEKTMDALRATLATGHGPRPFGRSRTQEPGATTA